MEERRAHPRKSVVCRVELEVLGGPQRNRQFGLQEDISVQGCCVVIRKPLEIGTRVKIIWRDRSVTGVVRQCRHGEGGFFIGIMFDTDTWTQIATNKR